MKTQAREIRFIAKSAEEAADRVRRELGPDAKVVSVRQVTGSGLQRFLVAPRLEIIAREIESTPSPVTAAPVVDDPQEDVPQVVETPVVEEVLEEVAGKANPKPSWRCGDLLARAGFSPALMARLEGAEEWRLIQGLSIEEGLPRAISWLQNYRASRGKMELPNRIAFLGGPGSGKTTSLCKYLAREVFIHGNKPEVLRLEVDKPHLDNGLSLYCEILGVNCRNDPSEVDFSGEQPVLVDLPGFSLHVDSEKRRIRQALDEIEVSGRVVVLNAAYEWPVMQRFAQDGAELGANFQVLTHVDEVMDFGKLWTYLLDRQRQVLFFSNGQNVAGDIVDDTFGFLMERTFPQ